MRNSEVEIEVKFYVGQLNRLVERLKALGAKEVQPRIHELNLRFDTPEGELTAQRQVLRLRKDHKAWLTYKGPAQPGQTVGVRPEIEFEVSSFDEAKNFLKALGYQIYMLYEKYRQVYDTGEVLVMLDELPYGCFVEIEGPDADTIQKAADLLNLDWEARCAVSYLDLFYRLKSMHGLSARHLCFDEFKGTKFGPEDMGICKAD
jgi:adenylate cyclase class 2